MEYTKQPLSIQQQIDKLKSRGLIIDDESIASSYLSNISYYRLRAYTYPFQKNNDDDEIEQHRFIRNDLHFKEIIDLYCFDRRLRALIFNAIEKIEVAIRTKIVYEFAMETNDSHWFLKRTLYRKNYDEILESIEKEVDRSEEDFIKHYNTKYDDPDLPPAWMTLEVLSFGTLSKMFEYLNGKDEPCKRVAKAFGLPNPIILENWMHSLSVLRNYSAHHSRIWNRRFMAMTLPYNTTYPFIGRDEIKTIRDNKLFAALSCIKYILDIISPNSDFKNNLINIIGEGGNLLKIKDMGFPVNWKYLDVWKEK